MLQLACHIFALQLPCCLTSFMYFNINTSRSNPEQWESMDAWTHEATHLPTTMWREYFHFRFPVYFCSSIYLLREKNLVLRTHIVKPFTKFVTSKINCHRNCTYGVAPLHCNIMGTHSYTCNILQLIVLSRISTFLVLQIFIYHKFLIFGANFLQAKHNKSLVQRIDLSTCSL